ncbi:MAG: hypothetical protein LBB94_02920 [Clostridiales bacterium]|jgi:Mor family transcriptional regulator|nr:hypothetical protein [Clostridiales bacterium]
MNKRQIKEIVTRYKTHLPEPAVTMLDILGYDGLCALSERYGGDALYIPKQANLFIGCLRQAMVDEYNGFNQRELSDKYGVSQRTVRRLANRKLRAAPAPARRNP